MNIHLVRLSKRDGLEKTGRKMNRKNNKKKQFKQKKKAHEIRRKKHPGESTT